MKGRVGESVWRDRESGPCVSETIEEKCRLQIRQGKDLIRKCGSVLANWVWFGAEVKPGDMEEIICACFALYSRPGRARFTRVGVRGSPSVITGHDIHDLEKSLSLGWRHV